MDDIHLCPLCRGNGLNPHHPKIYDTPAGKYTIDMLCPICKGSGYDPRQHPDEVEQYSSSV